MSSLIIAIAVALFASFKPAGAYIDPATTSYVLELIIGAVVVGGAAFGYYWRKIKNKVKKTDDSQQSGPSVDDQLKSDDDED